MSSATSGSYEITVTGLGGGKTRTASAELVVTAPLDWEGMLARFSELRDMYQVHRKNFFNNTWWQELAAHLAESAASYNLFEKASKNYVARALISLNSALHF